MNCLFVARIPPVEKIMNHLIDSGSFQVEIVGYYSQRSCVFCSEVRNILSQESGLKH